MSKTVIIDGKRYTVPDDATMEEIEALLAASAPQPMTEAQQAQDVLAGVNRGGAPYAAAAALGGGVGALFGGVGAGPGAAAGVGAVGLAQFVGDPLTDAVNSWFGTQFTKPTEALNQLMDAAGMPKPQGEGGQMAQAVTSGAVGALGGVGAARSLAAGAAPGGFWQGVGRTMAEAPVAQVAAGVTGAGAAEAVRQGGGGPIMQTVAGLAGGLAGGVGASTLGNFASKIGMPAPPRSDLPMLEQGFDNSTNMTVRVPMQQQQRAPLPMTYEDVARDTRTAATGGLGSQQAVERLARAAPVNKDAAAAAERLGIDVPPDVLMDHTQLKEAVGLTRSMPGTVASAAWVDAVERAATQADEQMALIDGSPDLSEISDTVLKSMNQTQADLQKQADEIYGRINARIKGGEEPDGAVRFGAGANAPGAAAAPKAGAAAPDVGALKQQGFNTDKVYYHGNEVEFDTFDMTKAGRREAPWYGRGAYLTPDRNSAKNYAAGGKVMPFYVRGNMLQIRKPEDWPSWLNKEADIPQQLKDRGYVGIDIDIKTQGPKYGPDFKPMVDKDGKLILQDESKPEIVVFDPANIVRADKGGAGQAAQAGAPSAPKPQTRFNVDLVNSRRLLDGVVRDLGNDVSKLTPLEKELREMAAPGRKLPVTYTALMRMKADVGQALQRSAGPYKDVDSAILKRLYGALSEDQLAHAQKVGGDTLRADLRLANQLVAKRKALEDRIVSLFGDERDGSIARKLVAALQGGAKGDITGFNRLVKSIPEDLRKKAIASAIAGAAREEKTNGFAFSKYVNLYQGLRRNSEVYKTVATTLGPDGDKFLRDLYEISKRITDARAQVLTTGKANQALVQGLMAEGLVEGVLRNTVGKKTVMGAPIVGPMVEALTKSNKSKLNAAGDLFASPEWQQLVINVSTKQQVNQKIYNAAKNSGAFRKWAREAGITDPDQWMRSAIASTIGMGAAAKSSAPYQAGMGREATE